MNNISAYAAPSAQLSHHEVNNDILVCDVSGSTADDSFEQGKSKLETISDAGREYLTQKKINRPGDSLALITYHTCANVVCPFTTIGHNFDELDGLMARLPKSIGGGTKLSSGLKAAAKVIRRGNPFGWRDAGPSRILAYSDGYDYEPGAAVRVAQKLKASGVLIETFGVGIDPSDVDEAFLKEVASNEDGFVHYRFLGDAAVMRETFAALATGMLTVED